MEEGFSLNFDKDNINNISVTYSNVIQDTIIFDKEVIEKIEELAEHYNVSMMKYFSDTLQIEMTKKVDLYIQQAFNEIIEEQYQRMEENKKR